MADVASLPRTGLSSLNEAMEGASSERERRRQRSEAQALGTERVAVADGEVSVEAKSFPSEHKKPGGEPVCLYGSERERSAMDALYSVVVTDLKLGQEGNKLGGTGSVCPNGYRHAFPLNVKCKLYGFQIRTLKNCTYLAPRIEQDDATGHVKPVGLEEVSRFRVERKDDVFDADY